VTHSYIRESLGIENSTFEAIMKWSTALLLQVSVSHAASIHPRSPQNAPAVASPDKPKGLGPWGLDLTMLKGFDLARLGPMLSRIQPYFKSAADSGMLANVAGAFIPTLSLKNKVVMQAEIRKSAKRVKSRLGPITLVGKGVRIHIMCIKHMSANNEKQNKPSPIFSPGSFISLDPNGQSFVHLYSASSLCTNCTVLAGKTGLEFEDGSPADPTRGVYIHHLISVDISRAGYLTALPCDFSSYNLSSNPISPIIPGAPFIGQGEDNGDSAIMFTSRDGTYDSGFKIGMADRFIIQSDMVNYNDDTKQVYITIDFEYVDGHVGEDVAPNLLSVTGCKLLEPKISASGPAETESQVFPILVDGTIISMSKLLDSVFFNSSNMILRGTPSQRWRESDHLP
jgi:hypothetical protein